MCVMWSYFAQNENEIITIYYQPGTREGSVFRRVCSSVHGEGVGEGRGWDGVPWPGDPTPLLPRLGLV